MSHNIFLSYSRKDIAIMHRLRDDLRAAGFTVWTDEGIEPGTPSWKSEIEKAIRDADCQVIIFSPDANNSRWVRAEIDFAETLHKPMFPLLLRGDETTSIPFGFSTYQWIDIRQPEDYASGFQMLAEAIQNRLNLPPSPPLTQSARMFSHRETIQEKATPVDRRGLWVAGASALVVVLVLLAFLVLRPNSPTGVELTPVLSETPAVSAVPALPTPNLRTRATLSSPMLANCPMLASQPDYAPVDPPTLTLPDDWVQVQSNETTVAFPQRYYLSPDRDNDFVNAIFLSMFDDAFQPFMDFGCSWQLDIFFIDMTGLRGGGVISRRVGVPLSLEAQRLYFEEALGDFAALETEPVTLPAGEMLRFSLNIETESMDAQMTGYSFAAGPMLYGIMMASASGTHTETGILIEQIAQTFRLVDK